MDTTDVTVETAKFFELTAAILTRIDGYTGIGKRCVYTLKFRQILYIHCVHIY